MIWSLFHHQRITLRVPLAPSGKSRGSNNERKLELVDGLQEMPFYKYASMWCIGRSRRLVSELIATVDTSMTMGLLAKRRSGGWPVSSRLNWKLQFNRCVR